MEIGVLTSGRSDESQIRIGELEPYRAIKQAFDLLVLPSAISDGAWQTFHESLSRNYEEFAAQMAAHLDQEDLLHLLALLLVAVGRNGFRTQETKSQLFILAQQMGVHVLPVHFYSPVPDTSQLPVDLSDRQITSAGRLIEPDAQLDFLRSLKRLASELSDVAEEGVDEGTFYWNNPAFGPMDAAAYYAIIRTKRPTRVIEVGSGYSTLLAAKAALRNGDTQLTCVEPYPLPMLRDVKGISAFIEKPVQEVPLTEFDKLRQGDVLFVDSTHVSKIGSDVNFLILEVLPRLREGVLVHFHDIFIPFEYPREWLVERNIFWNEQYLVLAYLLGGRGIVRTMHYYLGRTREDELREIFPFLPKVGGGSLWFETRSESGG
jgi:hypothetical protein